MDIHLPVDGDFDFPEDESGQPQQATGLAPNRVTIPDEFDEEIYRQAFPDVASALNKGQWKTGREHFVTFGKDEDRLNDYRYRTALKGFDTINFPPYSIDVIFQTPSGLFLVVGWLNDEQNCTVEILLSAGKASVGATREIARCRRLDAEAAIGAQPGKLLGFWGLVRMSLPPKRDAPVEFILVVGNDRKTFPVVAQRVAEDRLRELALEYLASATYFSNPQVESHIQLETGLGRSLIAVSVALSKEIISSPHLIRFGPRRVKLKGSIIVCLYGKPEFLFLQAAFFSQAPGREGYEFIYVSNSPELAETLVREARLAARIYDVSITLVILSGNAGFAAANNAAVEAAQSKRILIVNPDVFPRDHSWAKLHTAIIHEKPADQIAMFGVPLFYDDGSIMHAGMFIESDIGLCITDGKIEQREMLRVEHYGKGAPPGTASLLVSRPVPAVTGAFISADRNWFEALGGFSLEYGFGHYEDADLCLKSFAAGKPVWIHNIPFWHLEGKGSTRRPVHEGGSTVNRWHFTKTWRDLVSKGMCGQMPSLLAGQ